MNIVLAPKRHSKSTLYTTFILPLQSKPVFYTVVSEWPVSEWYKELVKNAAS